ncbi:MAG: twin-arginine translocase subunit TatB, partial [Gammaproteobacteria bacterium]|nr:twin-arginine translocase subunit TatB [Gammaproteobacteria bacterium]
MFDIGFWELSLIMVVALLVIGPERLPGVARKAGLWVSKARGFVRSVKADIEHEIAADELKKTLNEHAKFPSVHEIIEEARADISHVKEELKSNLD